VPAHRAPAAGSAGCSWVHGAWRKEALIYTAESGVKGMTVGISALKHTLRHSRLLSKEVL